LKEGEKLTYQERVECFRLADPQKDIFPTSRADRGEGEGEHMLQNRFKGKGRRGPSPMRIENHRQDA